MNRDEYRYLLAERGALREILDQIPADEVIDRASFQARLEGVERQMTAAGEPAGEPARARLTYRGRPVVNGHGVFAEFGLDATRAFVDAVIAAAAAVAAPLAASGPLPNREQNQLLITSTALGSFGFELEEYGAGGLLFPDDSPVAQALDLTQTLLQGTLGTDDELADSAAAFDPRAVVMVRAFLDKLAANEAVCALEYKDRTFAFTDVETVRRSLQRLSEDSLREEPQTLTGEFQGVLPKRRTFEFMLRPANQVITGKIGPGIPNPEDLNQHLYHPARIQVMTTRVGSGRPRYLLNQAPEWLGDTESRSINAYNK